MTQTGKRPLSIAIVDDDPDLLAVMEAVLSDAGHVVETHVAALYAISTIVRARPNVVLVDLRMSGIDGFELLSELSKRKELSRTVLIAVSAMSPEYWQEKAESAGADGFIQKPIDPSTFADQIAAMARRDR